MKTLKSFIKSLLGDKNEASYKLVEGYGWLSFHDQCHIEVSRLPSILICGEQVDGISGVSIPEFNREGLPAMYDGYLDEARVGIHQMLKYPSICNLARGLYYCCWLLKREENPALVVWRHWQSLQ